MKPVLHLSRRIDADVPGGPAHPWHAPTQVRTFADQPDAVCTWLRLRHEAFGTALPAWSDRDFEREFLAQPWWREDRMWFAVADPSDLDAPAVATVTLMCRSTNPARGAHLHWLLVSPPWRRQGLGKFLLKIVSNQARQLGYHTLHAETLATWNSAVAFYHACGLAQT